MNAPSMPALKAALTEVHDPEFGVNIVDLGLIYDIAICGQDVIVTLTLTSMYCPAGNVIMDGVRSAIERVPGVGRVTVNLVWEPVWTPDRLSPAAREHLGWDAPRIEA